MPDPGSRDRPDPSSIEHLVAGALESIEVEGWDALDAWCARHPEQADALRTRVQQLDRMGLVASGASVGVGDIGDYRVLGRLGSGGMGVVYLAHDRRLDRAVALKTLHLPLQDNERALLRFRREVRAVSRLRHPNIVPVYEMGEWNGAPFYTMEFVPGCTLHECLVRLRALDVEPANLTADDLRDSAQPAPLGLDASEATPTLRGWSGKYLEKVCGWMVALARALEVAHQQGTLHRDVKPSNIMVTPSGEVRLFDFGLAREPDEAPLTLSGDFLGTPHYASLEQVSGSAAVDARSDVYSIGATLYEMLTMRRPFAGEDTRAVLRAIETVEPIAPHRLNRVVPLDLATICLTALEKDPARRYQSAAAMADDLERFLEHRPVLARPVGTLTRAWRTVRRNPVPALLATLAALVLVAIPIGLLVAYLRIEDGRGRASALAAALEETLLEADYEELGRDAGARDLLIRAMDVIPVHLGDQPIEQARLLMKIGSVLTGLEEFEKAEVSLLRAQTLIDETRDGPHEVGAEVANHLGNLYQSTGQDDQSEAMYRRALDAARALDLAALERVCLSNFVVLLNRQNRLGESEELMERMLDSLARSAVPDREAELNAVMRLTWIAIIKKDPALARQRLGPVLGWLERYPDASAAERANVHAVAGGVANLCGDHEEALRCYEAQVEAARSTGQDESLMVAWALQSVALMKAKLERYEDALADYDTVRAQFLVGYADYPDHPALASVDAYSGAAWLRMGRFDEAERTLHRALERYAHGDLGHEAPHANAKQKLGETLLRRDGATPEARRWLEEARADYVALRGEASAEVETVQQLLDELAEEDR